ncbi:hypothetical protein ACFOGJ_06140 [Marinibaculum pumilum]|uniref:Uncharacterized protein n=1 Tax=Marinibaculum pumilum TaxID=1766165 RepID=A0ABV7KXF3_9PROT
MVQVNTSSALAAADKPEEDPGEVEFFTFEGPKISFGASIGTSHTMSVYGFKAVTSINHKNSISWGPASAGLQGPAKLDIAIKGARKTVKMDLSSSIELNPAALYHKAKERLAARGVKAEQDAKEDKEDVSEISTTVVDTDSNGDQNENNVEVTVNGGGAEG